MNYSIRYRSYARSFKRPLTTAHGVWSVREGIIVELRSRSELPSQASDALEMSPSQGSEPIGQGEIAPLPWFGSETQAEALDFCRSLAGQIDDTTIDTIPDRLPACQFAFESAREMLQRSSSSDAQISSPITVNRSLDICRLLPAGRDSVLRLDHDPHRDQHRDSHRDSHRQTYKWKIATAPIQTEFEIFQALIERLPAGSSLRLDANGGLTHDQAGYWLEWCDRLNAQAGHAIPPIEFLEQPLPPSQWSDLFQLSETFTTPIALDESIASLAQLRTAQANGWQGIYVIKPAIIGSPRRLRSLCTTHQLDAVFSSVFETVIGRNAGMQLAAELQTRDRAIGYGLDDWLMA